MVSYSNSKISWIARYHNAPTVYKACWIIKLKWIKMIKKIRKMSVSQKLWQYYCCKTQQMKHSNLWFCIIFSLLYRLCSYLTLKAPNKNCSRQHFIFVLLSFEENKAWFYMWILCLAEDLHETSSLIFSKKKTKKKTNEKIFINVVCCSCDWHFKG